MKKRMKRLRLAKETVCDLDLRHANGAVPTIDRTICVTNCPTCGDTNYQTCLSNATDCYLC